MIICMNQYILTGFNVKYYECQDIGMVIIPSEIVVLSKKNNLIPPYRMTCFITTLVAGYVPACIYMKLTHMHTWSICSVWMMKALFEYRCRPSEIRSRFLYGNAFLLPEFATPVDCDVQNLFIPIWTTLSQIFGQNGKLYLEISLYLTVSLWVGLLCHLCHVLTCLQTRDCEE